MNHAAEKIKVAVIGVGRMGTHHARTYGKLPGADLVGVVDQNVERAAIVADEHGGEPFADITALLDKHPDLRAVTVAVPTVHHRAAASPLLERGISCLVEKPLAPSVKEAKQLVKIAAKHGVILQVGHTERFNPVVRALMKYNLTPRFLEVVRISPMTFRSLDVGVVMDMMIHDLDIVLALADSPLKRVDATGVAVLAENEDLCNARLTFKNGCVANITASRLSLKTERKLRLFSEDAYVSLDYQSRQGIVIRKTDNAATLEDVRAQVAAGADLSDLDYTELVNVDPIEISDEEPDALTAELNHFLDSVRRGIKPEVDGVAGRAAVEAAEKVVAAIRAHKWQGIEEIV